MRTCTKCGVAKPLDEFSRRGRGDARRSACKGCQRKANQAYREADPETQRARVRDYYKKNPARKKAGDRRYQLRHPDKVVGWKRAYAERHAERLREEQRQWRAENLELARERGRQRQAKRRARRQELPAETIDLRRVFERDEGRCGLCGGLVDPTGWHLDHIIPIAAGGPHLYENVQVSHPECNQRKGARILDDLSDTGSTFGGCWAA